MRTQIIAAYDKCEYKFGAASEFGLAIGNKKQCEQKDGCLICHHCSLHCPGHYGLMFDPKTGKSLNSGMSMEIDMEKAPENVSLYEAIKKAM